MSLALGAAKPEVGDPDQALLIEQEVRRLDVAMDDAALMGIFERLGRVGAEPRESPGEIAAFSACGDETGFHRMAACCLVAAVPAWVAAPLRRQSAAAPEPGNIA